MFQMETIGVQLYIGPALKCNDTVTAIYFTTTLINRNRKYKT